MPDAPWNRRGIGAALRRLLAGRGLDDSAERTLFALVARRVLAPSSKMAAARGGGADASISGLPAAADDACCQAAHWLPQIRCALEREVSAPSAGASFAVCSWLFSRYPLAVTPHPADGECRSMALLNRAAGQAAFFVLTQAHDDLFVIRSWSSYDGVHEEIRPGEPVSDSIHRVITDGMPIPRDGALLGWVTDSRVTAMLAVRWRRPATWDATVHVPEMRVMPMVGTSERLHWPPFTASPLDDGRLWEYVEWGQIVDIVPLLTQDTGHGFWVPCPDGQRTRRGMGCVVVNGNLLGEEFWLPAGVYMDHWTLREVIEAPPAGQLLRLPGTVDLAHKLW